MGEETDEGGCSESMGSTSFNVYQKTSGKANPLVSHPIDLVVRE